MGWPHAASANAELALLLAGTERRRRHARSRVAELAASANPTSLIAYLSERRLLALVGSRLLEVAPDTPAAVGEAVAAAADRSRLEAMAIAGVTTQLCERMEHEGIPVLPLKGPRQAEALHGDSGLRASSDIDLLVPADALDRAVDVVLAEGYERPRPTPLRDGLPELHFELPHPRLPPVELHWRVHWYERRFSQAVLDASRPGPDGLRRAQPVDELAMLLLFFARDGFYGLRHAADVAAWWDRHAADAPGPVVWTVTPLATRRCPGRCARRPCPPTATPGSPPTSCCRMRARSIGVRASQWLSATGPPRATATSSPRTST